MLFTEGVLGLDQGGDGLDSTSNEACQKLLEENVENTSRHPE
mgnify:CR=1 FL=1